ncbi:hypothetical protein BHE74_00050020 [Ensete ventricosum]|nr:hypothetical protein BHE74_00050020 [Ensete ventricosum]
MIVLFRKRCPSPHCVAVAALCRRRRCTPSAWAAAPAVGVAAQGSTSRVGGAALRVHWPYRSDRHCRLQPWLRALPTPVGTALAGAGHARRQSRMLVAAPARGFGHG